MNKLTDKEIKVALCEFRNRLVEALNDTPRGITNEELCQQTLRVYDDEGLIDHEASCLTNS